MLTKGFYLGKYEVTQTQYEAITGSNPSRFNSSGNENRPVDQISWADAVAFCHQLTLDKRSSGFIPSDWEFVLPTEAQWEYACRAGTTTAFHGEMMSIRHMLIIPAVT